MVRNTQPQGNDSIVRRYIANGTLTVTRDEETNEHVITSNGIDRGDKWERRVPAVRTSVEVGEHLWSTPDNWSQQYRLKRKSGLDKGIYQIPESGDAVLLELGDTRVYLADAFHRVEAIGSVSWSAHASVDQDALSDALTHISESSDGSNEAVRHVLEYVQENPREAVEEAEEAAKTYAPECVGEYEKIPVSEFDPFLVPFRSEGGVVNHPKYHSENAVMCGVRDLINKFGIVPPSPFVSVTVR
jgi:hypothetical protein